MGKMNYQEMFHFFLEGGTKGERDGMMIGHLNSLQISQLTNCARLVQAVLIAVSNNPFNRCFVDILTISKFKSGTESKNQNGR